MMGPGVGGSGCPSTIVDGGASLRLAFCHKSQARRLRYSVAILAVVLLLSSCVAPDREHHIVVSARDQKLALLEKGKVVAVYPISTSKFGLGDGRGTCRTPLGELEVAQKLGDGA